MSNELIFLLVTVINLGIILFAFRMGKEWLFGVIVANIILVNTFSQNFVPFFGMVANASSVFYAAIFLATDLLTEHHGKKAGYKSVWIGFFGLLTFILLGQLAIRFTGIADTAVISNSLYVLFEGVPRIAFASLLAYVVAQNFDIWFYHFIHEKTGKKFLWLRNNLSTFTSQLIDTILFVVVAFAGVMPLAVLIEVILTVYLIKVLVALFDTPFIYLSYIIKGEKKFHSPTQVD